MAWNLRGGKEVRYQEELPACQKSETWLRGGEGEGDLGTGLLRVPPSFSPPPLAPPPAPQAAVLCSEEALSQDSGIEALWLRDT